MTSTTTSAGNAMNESFSDDQVVARYLKLLADGQSPSLDDFCAAYPAAERARVRAVCAQAAAARALLGALRKDGPHTSWPDLSGRQLGEYELVHEIGRGGMGVVYLARQHSLQRDVAVKVLPVVDGMSPRALARFQTEALATARVDDPRIVKVFAVGEQEGVLWIALEYVVGRSLHAELHAHRQHGDCLLPRPDDAAGARRIARFLAEIARGLHAAHRAGVIHRDVQPNNILIDKTGTPKLIDFGLARILEQPGQTRSGEVMGTPYYMSPEQVRARRGEIDHRSDIFSLGSVMYELLTLARPFQGSTSHQVLDSIARHDPVPVRRVDPRVPLDLALLCAKAMEKDQRHRFVDALEFADELERFAGGQPILLQPPSWAQIGMRAVARRRRPLLAAVGLAAALGGGVWWARPRVPAATLAIRAAHLAGARVVVRPIDPATWTIGPARQLGTCPLEVSLPLGYYHVVMVNATGFAELTRYVANRDQVYEIADHVRIQPDREARAGMVCVAAGEFEFGTKDQEFPGNEVRRLHLDEYWIDETEVSNASYRAFLLATGWRKPAMWPANWREAWNPAWDDLPAAGVALEDARAFAEWSGRRLPTEQEWEKAGRGTHGWLLPWRADFDEVDVRSKANVGKECDESLDWDQRWQSYLAVIEPVRNDRRSNATSIFGLYHLVGNVTEWTDNLLSDWVDGKATPRHGYQRIRGAWFANVVTHWPLNTVLGVSAVANLQFFGFRCAKSSKPPVD